MNECSPSILILNGNFPVFPGTGGHEFLNTTNLASLASSVGLVSMLHTADAAAGVRAFRDRGVELYLWQGPHTDGKPVPPRPSGLFHRMHASFVDAVIRVKAFPSRPLDTIGADLDFRNMSAPLLKAIRRRHWNAFIVVQSTSAAAIDYIPKPEVSVLMMHDIRSVVFARRAAVARSWRERAEMRRQARLYFEYEKKYSSRYDLTIALSESDARWIREHYQPRRVEVVSIPVDAGYFAPAAETGESTHRILFTGLMQHPPNVDAARYFAEQVFPRVREKVPDAEFFIVGKSPTADVLALGELPGITVTGSVPDTRPYLAEAAVVTVPLRYGSGVRNKILEAWGMEKCVVSTTVGAEGLACEDGANLVISDTPETMSHAVIRAMEDRSYSRRVGCAGRQIAVEQHDPGKIAATYYDHVRSVASEKMSRQRMRIALDMRWMIPGEAGGLENLARAMVNQLLALDGHNSYTMILPAVSRYTFDLRRRPNFRVITRDSVMPVVSHMRWSLMRSLHSLLRLDYWRSAEVYSLEFLRSLDADIVYSFPGFIHPEVSHLRQVLSVPDIQHEYFPQFFSAQALEERRRVYTDSILAADHLCAISEFTRQTLIERLHVSPEKITTTLLAADPIYRQNDDRAADKERLRKYGLADEPFLFFPAHTWPHKNHQAAVAALTILRDKYGLRPQLVCTGGARGAQTELEKQIEESGLRGQVRFLGYCPGEDLPALYRTAGCLVFPSLFEGFGMPVLEAMACGCPVVCSNTTSLPEIAGDAALLVDPTQPEAIAKAIQTVFRLPDLRQRLVSLGLERARLFSWQRYTLETVAVLHRLHSQLRSSSR